MLVIFSNYFSSNKDIHHHHTRSSSLLHLSSVSTSVCTKSTKFKASQLWNTLPERLRKIKNLMLLKMNSPITWLTLLWAKIISIINRIGATVIKCDFVSPASLSILFTYCVMCVCLFFFTRWPASLGLCLFWQPATWFIYLQLCCIVSLFMLWQIKFSLARFPWSSHNMNTVWLHL